MLTELSRQFNRLQEELEQNNRLRWGVLIILLLAVVWVLLVLSDQNRERFVWTGSNMWIPSMTSAR